MEKQRLHAIVEGRVQGVGFRYFALEISHRHNLTGWVRNCFNGNVELTAEGTHEDLETLLLSVQEGPSGSLVTNVMFDWLPAENTFTLFSIRPASQD